MQENAENPAATKLEVASYLKQQEKEVGLILPGFKEMCEVFIIIDTSASMGSNFPLKVMMAITLAMPVSLWLDSDKRLPIITLGEFSESTGEISKETWAIDFVERQIAPLRSYMSGDTLYAKAIEFFLTSAEFVKRGKAWSSSKKKPRYCIVITDGDNNDKAETLALLQQLNTLAYAPYFQFIGVGKKENFSRIKKQADDLNHVGFLGADTFGQFANMTPEETIQMFLTKEACNWLKNFN